MHARASAFLVALGLLVSLILVVSIGGSSTAGPPTATNNGDVNGDQGIDIGDAVYLLGFLFSSGPAPVAFAGGTSCECDQGEFRISSPPGSSTGARLLFGPTDDCSLGIDPALPGLIERDPVGLRLLGPNNQGGRLLFGPTDDCSISISPTIGPLGLLLRDPSGIRVLDPVASRPRLLFGPTDDCSLGIDPNGPSGLLLRDPAGVRVLDLVGNLPILRFGPTDDCSLGIEPSPTGTPAGLVIRDPAGVRILDPASNQPTLRFGRTDDCSIGVSSLGPSGLLLRDPSGTRVLGSSSTMVAPSRLIFGPTDDCTISVSPPGGAPGMRFADPIGFFFDGGPVFATQFIPTSTERFKGNIRPIDGALAKLQALKGVQFEWKDRLGGKTDIGFVAEEVLKVIPEVVACDEDGTARGVCYDHLVALAVEGIKEQQGFITGLESEKATLQGEVAALKAQNESLAERLARLETLVGTLTADRHK
jgi:hypothetical protein